MDKFEMRRERLLHLIGERCGGRKSECARRIGRSQSYLGRLLYPAGKSGKKNIADTLITAIEAAFDLPAGWLDGAEDTGEVNAISKLWPLLSKHKRIAIVSLIDAMAHDEEPEGGVIPDNGEPDTECTATIKRGAGLSKNSISYFPARRRENRERRASTDRRILTGKTLSSRTE